MAEERHRLHKSQTHLVAAFMARGDEMVKGAAIETALILLQRPPTLTENYAVAVHNMNIALLGCSKSCLLEQNKLYSSSHLHSHSPTPATSTLAGRGR